MKSKKKVSLLIGIILLSITSVYPLNTKKEIPNNKDNSFWNNYESNWKNTSSFNSNTFWNQEETITVSNDRTITISNKKINQSTDDSFQDNKGNNIPNDLEYGNTRWKGFRFTNLNIPANATITNVELTLYGYSKGNTTVNVKAEKLNAPPTFSSSNNYLSTRSTTSKSENWYIPKLSNGTVLKSPNLKDVVQEVVDSKGEINHLSLIISSSAKWIGWNYDDRSSSYYPKINISYTVSSLDVVDDKHTMDANTAAVIPVFDNDSNLPTKGTLTIAKSPKNGKVQITEVNPLLNDPSDDTVTYTPNSNFDGTDTFNYKVCDSNNNCDTATVAVTINSNIDPCNALLSGELDTDKDGIADACDLDDDNDGILDTDECPTVIPFSFKLNINNKTFTNSGKTGDVGDVMLYKNVGTHLNTKIDLKISVIANSDPNNMTIDISGFKYGSDLYPVLLGGKNTKENPYASVKFEFLKNGTNELINVAPSFMFKDIDFLNDGTGESVEIDQNLVSSYSLSKNPSTDLYVVNNVAKNYVGSSGNFMRINSKKELGGLTNENLWIAMQLLEVNAFNINLLKRTGNTGYVFESDSFSKTSNTVQLDADCSLDTDNDGIPDYLDTDSDNDGCPDATEAANNISTIATLPNGSNGGSSRNLGIVSNKNGIPLLLSTKNGTETTGQDNTSATKIAEKMSINSSSLDINGDKGGSVTMNIEASSVKTNTFLNGVPNYNEPNGTDTSNSLTYKWYKSSDPSKTISTSKSFVINSLNPSHIGEYVVIITGINSSCSEQRTVKLNVNDTPTALVDVATVNEDSTNNSIKVLVNDTFGGDGPNSGKITISSSKTENKGTISVDDNSTPTNPLDDKINYTPAENFNGSDTFKYTITDASGDSSTAKVTVNVKSVNDLPTTVADSATINEDSSAININVLANDSFGGDGPNKGTIELKSNTSDQKGTISVNNNNTPKDPTDDKIKYTPLSNFNGTDTFSYTIYDVNGDSSSSIVTVTVKSTNDLPTVSADAVTVKEDTKANYINVLENDNFGGDGANKGTIILVTATSNKGGTLTINDNNTTNNPVDDSILYTPAEDFYGTDTFQYSITDANGDTATATVTVTVTNVNDNPISKADTVSVNEDSTNNSIDVLVNDSFGGDGPNTEAITISSNTTINGGSVSVDNNGTPTDPTDDKIIYTPVADFNGTDKIKYTITDKNGDSSSAVIKITVIPTNDIPTAISDAITVDEDSSKNTINVLANDSFGGDGPNAGSIILSTETSTKGGKISVNKNNTSSNPTDDTIIYSPAENFNGTDTIEYKIIDKNGDTSSAEITITVNSINDSPKAFADATSVDEDSSNNSIVVLSNDSFGGDGPNTGTISIPSATSTENGTISINNNGTNTDPTDDKITYTPFANFKGIDTFNYTITDANGDTSTAEVTINVNDVNDVPVTAADAITVDEDSTNTSIDVLANDTFGGDGPNSGTIKISSTTTSNGGTISVDDNSTATNPTDDKIIYTPLANFNGTDTFKYSITDVNGDTSSAMVTVTVNPINDSPVATADTATVNEDSKENYINVLENDSFGGDGANTGAITIESATSNKGGSLAVNNNNTANNPKDDAILYTPLENFNGTDSFDYTITDANGDTSKVTVTITVTAVNDTPSATEDTVTVDEDSTNNSFNVLANDTFGGDGSNNGSITISSNTTINGGTINVDDNSTATDPTDDKITYSPLANFNGKDKFAYTITDKNGDTSTTEVTVNVTSINDTPIAVTDTTSVDEDSSNNTINVLTNDSFGGDGPSKGAITLSARTSTKEGIISVNNNNTPNDPTDDTITYTPAENFNGTDTFKYTIVDNNGDTSSAEITVTVNSINDRPTASSDTVTVDEDSTNNNFNVLNNDTFGGDGPNNGTITITSASTTKNGTISIDDNATEADPTDDKVIYTPKENFNGTDSFEYTITDANGDTSIAEVTITVTAINDLPTADSDTVTVDEDSKNNAINVLENDTFGGDGANIGAITISSETSTNGGAISVDKNATETDPTDDKIIYTPAENFNGTDSFEYTITDANGDKATTKVAVKVNAVNDTPTANADTFSTNEDSLNNKFNVLENDSFGGDGSKNGTVSVTSTTTSKGGTVSINNNETENNPTDDIITYTPLANFNGIDSFEYSITDSNGDVSKTTVTITVNAVNDLPETSNDTVSANEDSTNNSFDVLANDSFGGDGSNSGAISLSTEKSNNGGTLSIDNNGTETNPTDDKILYTPVANFTGTDTFEYIITDANGDTATGKVTINVNPTGTQYNPLSATECFNIFVQNNLTVSNGNTAGSIATGGDLTFKNNYGVAAQDCGCFAVNDIKLGMLVNGKVNYPENGILNIKSENQYAKIGVDNNATVWYQDPDNKSLPIRITPSENYKTNSYIQLANDAKSLNVSNSNNPVIENNIIDFAHAFQQLQTASLSLSSEAHNATILNSDYEKISNTNLPSEIIINLENGVNYFNITGADLNKVTNIAFYEKPTSKNILIINIDASEGFDWNVWQQKGLETENSAFVLYNFYNTSTLNIKGDNELFGSLFASFADITKTENKANVTGQIIGKSLNLDGGDISCANFESSVYSPQDAKTAPIADFTINDDNQCFVGNQFNFTNATNTGANAQPTAPISYSWNFGNETSSSLMNPTKNYKEAGIYEVTLTAKNAYGSNIKTMSIEIIAITTAIVTESNSIIDEEAGTITKEYTLSNDTDFTSFTWSLNGFDTSSFDNKKTVSFEFTEEGEHVLELKTFNNDCDNTIKTPITITSDEVSTGNDGGLESESLGDAISIRYFQRKTKSVPTIFKKTSDIVYNKKKMVKALAKKSNELTMLEMFPEELVDGDVAHVTSPTDILDFTIAAEVLSVDFSINEKTIGVVLGVKTLDQIYNHTKATCDRLRGAEILNVKTIEIGGYNFLQQAIKQRSGIIEHAISFAVSKNKTEEFYKIQSNWYVFDYTAANEVFNFQVWASEPANTVKMVTDILANLNNSKTVLQSEKQKSPKTYVTKVARVTDKLVMNLKSFDEADALEISMTEKLSETNTDLNLRYTPLNSKSDQVLELDINDGYEYDGDVKFDGEIQDAFYHADGNWGLEYDRRYTTVQEYEVTNNFDREYAEDELPINRNISVKAYSESDYLSVYKSLLPGTISADYSSYKYLSFTAKGQGPTQLVLVKSSVENWSDQYRATVNLTEEEQTFFIPFDSFTSIASIEKINADDLTTISFTYVAEDAGTNNLDMTISDVKFTKTNSALNIDDEFIAPMKNKFMVYPNPSKGNINCTVFSDYATKANITLFDITGKTVYKGILNLTEGKNELNFNFRTKAGVMFLKINSPEINYGTSKIVFK